MKVIISFSFNQRIINNCQKYFNIIAYIMTVETTAITGMIVFMVTIIIKNN